MMWLMQSPLPRYSDDYSLHVGVLSSIIVHVIALLIFTLPTQDAFKPSQVFDVTIEPQSTIEQQIKERQQIVTPPEQESATPPQKEAFQSDKDNSVLKQQIKRGTENAAPAIGEKKNSAQTVKNSQPIKKDLPDRNEPKTPEKEVQKPLTNLKLDTDTLINQFALSAKSDKPNDSSKNQRIAQSSYRAFSRPMGSGAMFIGLSGSSDHLPNLPDGDITLLNTKANKFAVFVRRVATQVFAQIRAQGWDYLSAGDIDSISGYATVRAILSPRGELLKVSLESSSRSSKFDEVIIGAAQKGASDPNPPKDAVASDGNVHFIFQAKSWVQVVPAPRSGIPTQRRWLLLATGLD